MAAERKHKQLTTSQIQDLIYERIARQRSHKKGLSSADLVRRAAKRARMHKPKKAIMVP